MDNFIESSIFTNCVVCSELRNNCNCKPCDNCGIIEFCICSDIDKIYSNCICKTHTIYENLVCDCSCPNCIGQRLDFQGRIQSGAIPLPWCNCEWTQIGDGITCTCTCTKCSNNECHLSISDEEKCPNCDTLTNSYENYGFCSRSCMVEYLDDEY